MKRFYKLQIFHSFLWLVGCWAISIGTLLGQSPVLTAAEQFEEYLPLISGKKIGLVVNQTSIVGDTHLVDTLVAMGIDIKRIFAPEHGFRGNIDRGEKVRNTRDKKSGAPIVSLYGKNYKPTNRQVQDLDYMIFDIQDVGVRCFTYTSTLHYVMEACAENNIKLLVLDRPNPNAHYVDGPVMEKEFQSYVGKHPIPLVYGLTIGELGTMINGEGWLKGGVKCDMEVIPLKNYTHGTSYELPVRPSPNLPDKQSIALYPTLVWFEGTPVSVGRGTYEPFQVIGYPDPEYGEFSFVPKSISGMQNNPVHKDLKCYGLDLRTITPPNRIELEYLVEFYKLAGAPDDYFTPIFNLLVGTDQVKRMIESGKTADEIRSTWQPGLDDFKLLRSKYLLYPE